MATSSIFDRDVKASSEIVIRGACHHNLKNLSLNLPKGKFILFTGPSGSGKSSLAFDTLYAEGQRRYIESLSAYARQFLEMKEKPKVESIEGLSPAIAIEQKTIAKNPRSTVGTVTEIYDYLRLLFARAGTAYSPATGLPIEAQSRSRMIERICTLPFGTRFYMMAPIARGVKGEFLKVFADLKKQGYTRIQINGEVLSLEEPIALEKNKRHTIYVIVDRLCREDNEDAQMRLAASLESALHLGKGLVHIESVNDPAEFEPMLLSSKFACPVSGFTLEEIEPRLFSFNNPFGACRTCGGLGVEGMGGRGRMDEEEEENPSVFPPCKACQGTRLRSEALCVRLGTHKEALHIGQVCAFSIEGAYAWCQTLVPKLSMQVQEVAERILKEISARLSFLMEVGLGYLSCSRASATLSGGESQRIRLASQVGSGLTGVLYVLDEPSIGLHPRDNEKLLKTLSTLRDLGNTVIVVEHDEEAIRAADHILDFGPASGEYGGEIIAQGSIADILASPHSLTGAYLRKERSIPVPTQRRKGSGKKVGIRHARVHNLKEVEVDFPLGTFMCVTGVSGSGKSSLIMDTLCKGIARHKIHDFSSLEGETFVGVEEIDKLIPIDQAPIGRTPRSNPATYAGAFTPIREWFAWMPEARARGYGPGRFSFNVPGGRCEACHGEGTLTIAMHFLSDMTVPCDTCKGKRYSYETLEIRYKQHSIADVLECSIAEAAVLFEAIPSIAHRLQTLIQVGLGYLKVGHAAPMLSGGEAQRVKLAKELCKRPTGKTLYILDEPTTGLHFEDVKVLLGVLHRLVDQGNSVLVIEHNLEVIKTADWILDMGPEGGDKGGNIVAMGTPEEVASNPNSLTGKYLAPLL
jgi:excinuclease ABC subunit A